MLRTLGFDDLLGIGIVAEQLSSGRRGGRSNRLCGLSGFGTFGFGSALSRCFALRALGWSISLGGGALSWSVSSVFGGLWLFRFFRGFLRFFVGHKIWLMDTG